MNPQRDARMGPSADDLEKGTYYTFRIDCSSDAPGTVSDKSDVILWKYNTEPKRGPYSVLNLIKTRI